MFEIISDIVPVLNIIIFFFYKNTRLIKFAYAKKSIVELLFENNLIKNKKKYIGRNLKNNDSLKFSKDKIDINNLNNFNDVYKLNNNYNHNQIKDVEILNQKKNIKNM